MYIFIFIGGKNQSSEHNLMIRQMVTIFRDNI